MSEHKVEVVKITEIIPHPNADRLEIALLDSMAYKVIVAKDKFQVGDLAIYFPVESVLSEKLVKEFGINTYYSKKLRAVKLRGIFSEGLLVPLREYPSLVNSKPGDDVTTVFGVHKYSAPLPQNMNGDAEAPIGHHIFPSPENLKRYPNVLHEGEEVVISEKVHGANFTTWIDPNGIAHIGSHRYFWKDNATNENLIYIKAYHQYPELKQLPANTQVFGELIGTQDIRYGLKQGSLALVMFAVKKEGHFLDHQDFVDFCAAYKLPTVPILYKGPYSWDIARQFNNAMSKLDPDNSIMEGVIVQPIKERSDPLVGRVVLKLISDKYLLRKNGTEFH